MLNDVEVAAQHKLLEIMSLDANEVAKFIIERGHWEPGTFEPGVPPEFLQITLSGLHTGANELIAALQDKLSTAIFSSRKDPGNIRRRETVVFADPNELATARRRQHPPHR